MKFYLAVSMTSGQNPLLARSIVDWLESEGHEVLDRHVAYAMGKESMDEFCRNAKLDLTGLTEREIANKVRDQGLRWVRRCHRFIGIFFGTSDGRGMEFEHLRLLLELELNGKIEIFGGAAAVCRKMLCIFPSGQKSKMVFGISDAESQYIHQEFVFGEAEVLPAIQAWLKGEEE
ncbi:MAG: hypothetical protein A3F25_02345 [Candidatus Yanofskybacteria bacterium RIFCSPHIGHO2_12_FULL_45_19b]|uniref:Flavodoxin-like domain-containing protein n=1 Tax=Candidatus Yanofskybacteria bacterium RIFCSPHIGHO2_12_FULL_45_19b TaxID=1802689 RepID=A0A1F8G7Q4_9BACT|nr:MAG: hypothetical protein A3F25_02345 [Candidatus Yanofskybacteria bacterium RIFCSPHIGHO2_12_FULL_45_19b]